MGKYGAKIRNWAKKYKISLNSEFIPIASYEHETYESLHNCLFDIGHESGNNPPMPGVMASEKTLNSGQTQYLLNSTAACLSEIMEKVYLLWLSKAGIFPNK